MNGGAVPGGAGCSISLYYKTFAFQATPLRTFFPVARYGTCCMMHS